MIAVGPRPGAVRRGSTAPSSRSAGWGCSSGPPRARSPRLRPGAAGAARDVPGGPRGLAHAVRLRRRRRARRLRAAADRLRGRAPARPRDARRARPRRPAPGVAAEDLTALMQVPGIGRKGAQRIVLELTDRLGRPAPGAAHRPRAAPRGVSAGGTREQVVEALVGLGWAQQAGRGRGRRASSPPTGAARRHRRHGRCWRRAARPWPTCCAPPCAAWPGRERRRDRPDAGPADGPAREVDPAVDAGRAGRGGRAATPPAGRVRRPARRPRAARRSCSRPPGAAAARPTTCCSPARPGSARPRWR